MKRFLGLIVFAIMTTAQASTVKVIEIDLKDPIFMGLQLLAQTGYEDWKCALSGRDIENEPKCSTGLNRANSYCEFLGYGPAFSVKTNILRTSDVLILKNGTLLQSMVNIFGGGDISEFRPTGIQSLSCRIYQ